MVGVSSMTSRLHKVALRKPGKAMQDASAQIWHYGPTFDKNKVEEQHATFTHLLTESGVEVLWMDDENPKVSDAVFTYDASLMTPAGAILMNPGKPLRKGEQELHRQFYQHQSIPVVGEISGTATAEAGDTLWLDNKTLIVGRGFRTNQNGVEQITSMMASQGITVLAYDLPVYQGINACLHLMSLISLVDTKKAAIHQALLPVALYQLLQDRGFELITLPPAEYEASATLSGNILAVAPGECIMIDGYPETRKVIKSSGVNVRVFDGAALCIGCEGGPTCLTRPISRI